jgi:hypothetical protein
MITPNKGFLYFLQIFGPKFENRTNQPFICWLSSHAQSYKLFLQVIYDFSKACLTLFVKGNEMLHALNIVA